jgi:hypothetical protein
MAVRSMLRSMFPRKCFLFLSLFALLIVVTSCRKPAENGLTFAKIDLTYAVQTVVVQLSQTVPASVETILPSLTPTRVFIPQRTVTHTPVGLFHTSQTPTATQQPCEAAAFVMDVTAPSGTRFYAGDQFLKIWRLRNVGSCSWSNGYALVFVEGDSLSLSDAVPLPGEVLPFQEVDIAVPMLAPNEPGRYRGGWKLRNPSGKLIELQSGAPVYITIEVIPSLTSGSVYNFAEQFCEASWSSSANGINPLACPGNREDETGYVYMWEEAVVEGNRQTNAPVLEMHPPMEDHPLWDPEQQGGWINAVFPPVRIQPGSRFRARIGCLQNAVTCDVYLSLQVHVPGLPWQELGFWRQEHDGRLEEIDIDLVDYVGLDAEFQFFVNANSSAGLDQAVWINPRIEN